MSAFSNVFQFLMVRLKVLHSQVIPSMRDISIPYGAIKSLHFEMLSPSFTTISIPYGAIKRGAAAGSSSALINFNSLWCD